jgi:hypothetical protein
MRPRSGGSASWIPVLTFDHKVSSRKGQLSHRQAKLKKKKEQRNGEPRNPAAPTLNCQDHLGQVDCSLQRSHSGTQHELASPRIHRIHQADTSRTTVGLYDPCHMQAVHELGQEQ